MSGNTVNDWLAAARTDAARPNVDPMVEAQLLARVRERSALHSLAGARAPERQPQPSRPAGWRPAFGIPLAFAALLAALIGMHLLAPAGPAAPEREVATPFIALVAGEALAAERAPVVVTSQVARAALADYGLPVDPARVDEPVGAEFLVSRTGVVLAVRFKE